MNPYVFMTDSDSDLPFHYVDELELPVVYMPYTLEGKEYFDDLGRAGRQKDYFDKMRAGATPVTSLLPKDAYIEYFEPIFQEGKDLLFVAFSSQMSGTINNVYAAREELLEKYPERKMMVVDTLSISVPMAILVVKAHALYREGKPMEEVADWLEKNKMRAQAFFTVDDLVYLRRGGRVGLISAAMGTMLDLKPIITEARCGKLISTDKVQGRKRALRTIADKSAENIDDPAQADVYILHADVPEDAERLVTLMEERVPALKGTITVQPIGPVIGAHCGPGTVAICFFGKERTV